MTDNSHGGNMTHNSAPSWVSLIEFINDNKVNNFNLNADLFHLCYPIDCFETSIIYSEWTALPLKNSWRIYYSIRVIHNTNKNQ